MLHCEVLGVHGDCENDADASLYGLACPVAEVRYQLVKRGVVLSGLVLARRAFDFIAGTCCGKCLLSPLFICGVLIGQLLKAARGVASSRAPRSVGIRKCSLCLSLGFTMLSTDWFCCRRPDQSVWAY